MKYNPNKIKELSPNIDAVMCANRRCSNLFFGRLNQTYCCPQCRKMENHAKTKDKKKIKSADFATSEHPNTGKPLETKPERYTKGKIECIEAIKSAVTGKRPEEAVMVGNIIKYLWRYESKGGLDDIKKAKVYLDFLEKEIISNQKLKT